MMFMVFFLLWVESRMMVWWKLLFFSEGCVRSRVLVRVVELDWDCLCIVCYEGGWLGEVGYFYV